MLNKIKTTAIELSEAELDAVAGGAIVIGDVGSFAQSAMNDFFQKNATVAQQTFAGPDGSGTASVTTVNEIFSSAGNSIAIG